MKLRLFIMLNISLLLYGCGAEHLVEQNSKKFSVNELKIQAGDKVKFVNNDPIAHLITYKVGEERISHRQVKDDPPLIEKFSEKGEYLVTCAIHPRMELKILVE